jgi:hypothetical protein
VNPVARRDDGAGAPPDVVDLTGTYYNTGYGTVVLCSVHSSSPSCGSVLDDFRTIDPFLSSDSTDLFAPWNTVSSTHARFTYTNSSQYTINIDCRSETCIAHLGRRVQYCRCLNLKHDPTNCLARGGSG